MKYYLVHTNTTLFMRGRGVSILGILAYKVNNVYFNAISNQRFYKEDLVQVVEA